MRKPLLLAAAVAATASLGLTACDTNSYWYCWDNGDVAPHHLGHYVSGDHVCADSELKGTGFDPK